ncbi:MAG: hypothetical protein OIN89_05020 [Candidatus Methanoperedens sp.]|jgi:hypothetical protein|nr:hypothetical protein [Candidatus Methanoperedens sp.]PKL52800.1 MAG: hypothetical protein CVV36_10595 [Candidatus Methanoperedenaceae archaeon HGW-Methanoperedenaceae-1]
MKTLFRNTKNIKTAISTYWIIFGLFWIETVFASEDSVGIKLTVSVFLGILPLLMGWWLVVESGFLNRTLK